MLNFKRIEHKYNTVSDELTDVKVKKNYGGHAIYNGGTLFTHASFIITLNLHVVTCYTGYTHAWNGYSFCRPQEGWQAE